MLTPGRIPLNEQEHNTVERLLAGAAGALTRRDPGNTGPVIVHTRDAVYEVGATGRAKKVT
jgi:hypothetical protein